MKPILYSLLLCISLFGPLKLSSNNIIVKGKGYLQSEFRIITPFTRIESRIGADINIIKSKIRNIEITAQGNLLPLIQITERDGLLIISTGNYSILTDSLVKINIYLPAVEEIRFSGSGTLYSECPVERIFLSGTGDITCTGKTQNVSVHLSGSGKINLLGMKLKTVEVKIIGIGEVCVNVKDKLVVLIPGAGTLFYKGKPFIRSEIPGTGRLICLN